MKQVPYEYIYATPTHCLIQNNHIHSFTDVYNLADFFGISYILSVYSFIQKPSSEDKTFWTGFPIKIISSDNKTVIHGYKQPSTHLVYTKDKTWIGYYTEQNDFVYAEDCTPLEQLYIKRWLQL